MATRRKRYKLVGYLVSHLFTEHVNAAEKLAHHDNPQIKSALRQAERVAGFHYRSNGSEECELNSEVLAEAIIKASFGYSQIQRSSK
jgi:hypothetical protein